MAVSPNVKNQIRIEAKNRCGYCLSQQAFLPYTLEIEHIFPTSRGGEDSVENLWLACRACNLAKSNKVSGIDKHSGQEVPLFNPRTQKWDEHFQWSKDSSNVIGITPIGRATVLALKLNNFFIVTARKNWVQVGWHPPSE